MRRRLIPILALSLMMFAAAGLCAQDSRPPDPEEEVLGLTPARLSFVDGRVSFLRPGAGDWVRAQVNTALSPGDQLFTGSPGNLELQIGARAFVRGWADTFIGLENHEEHFIQFKVTTGHAAFDLRALEPGLTVEVATPNAAFTIDRPGYYRVDVVGDRTAFIARRGGRAVVTPEDGTAFSIAPSEEVVIEGEDRPEISSFSAPPLDSWDRWNYARTDRLLESESARYVPPGIYGAGDLDRHGRWRVVPEYGAVWVPTGVPAGWAPYSTGAWVHDPYYGWTWVDAAPWGWAPYHYGRWAHVGGFWGWAPGPMVVRPAYAPALVAFFGDPHVQISIGIGTPRVGWVALSWGEPCVPWWGRPGFIHRPWWGGWGGPRVINNVVIQHTTVVKVEEIHVYRNAGVRNAVVAVHKDRFGHGHIVPDRGTRLHAEELRPMHKGPEVRPTPAAFEPGEQRGIRPAEKDLKRSVVATRPPHSGPERGDRGERKPEASTGRGPSPRIVPAPQQSKNTEPLQRPPFGKSTIERRPPQDAPRSEGAERSSRRDQFDRRIPASPGPGAVEPSRPPLVDQRSADGPERSGRRDRMDRQTPPAPIPKTAEPSRPPLGDQRSSPPPERSRRLEQTDRRTPPAPEAIERHRPTQRNLPGEPASRLSPNRVEGAPAPQFERGAKPPQRPELREDSSEASRRGPKAPNRHPKGQGPADPPAPPASAR